MDSSCLNCSRSSDIVILTKHHVIPRSRGGKGGLLMILCDDCHTFLNTQYTAKEQASMLGTVELVLADAKMRNFGKFAAKQASGLSHRESRSRRSKRFRH